MTLKSVHKSSGKDVELMLRYKREIVHGERESIYLYNLCFHKIMKTLNFAQSAKKGNFFDAKAAKDIKVKSNYEFNFFFFRENVDLV